MGYYASDHDPIPKPSLTQQSRVRLPVVTCFLHNKMATHKIKPLVYPNFATKTPQSLSFAPTDPNRHQPSLV